MYPRICNPLLSNSFFLFGGRGTGKSTLLKKLLPEGPDILWVNLLDSILYQKLVARPNLFLEMIPAHFNKQCWIVADEIQRIPELLNLVHLLIEEKKIKFALTGSSARKLKRGSGNLLAGRAFLNFLYPLSYRELGNDFRLDQVINWGALPKIYEFQDNLFKSEYLKSYCANYLKEEIKEEQIVRQLDPFVRFLEVAAQMNGKIINNTKIGREAQTDIKAVIRYFQILEDTLLGFFLEPYHRSARKVQTSKAKFFLFDLGVKRALEGTLSSEILPGTYAYGNAFEHFFILECKKLKDYFRLDDKLYYLRTKDDVEIDLIIERPKKEIIAVEIKSSSNVDINEFKKAHALASDLKAKRMIIACNEKKKRTVSGIEIMPWMDVLLELYPQR